MDGLGRGQLSLIYQFFFLFHHSQGARGLHVLLPITTPRRKGQTGAQSLHRFFGEEDVSVQYIPLLLAFPHPAVVLWPDLWFGSKTPP
ncbi:Dper\GL25449-PA-like protein [Anopheles sinensis]|uniref:Dper\GL25449-PA-like protein n=1 Tax=Anopheles sinensis TaxID=74873 RepID=A0A084WLQ4_ANOSI|nr:Dper\GL25449-PA-like protein [Anopheles sinensis]